MAIDSNGFWFPEFPDNPQPTSSSFEPLSGSGVPDNSLGNNGQIYVNGDTGDVYVKSGDVWILVVGGSGAAEILRGSADDPNVALVTPSDPTRMALYFRDSVGNDSIQFWRWSVADQEWKDIITT